MEESNFATETRKEFASLRAEMRTEFLKLRSDMSKLATGTKKWYMAGLLAMVATIISATAFLYTSQRNHPAPQPQPAVQPIIIHLAQPGRIPPANK